MIGTVLRVRYEVTRQLQEGPIFAAYAAQDQVQPREVTVRLLKQPFSSEPEFVTKLGEVVPRLSTIQHPSIERILELDDHEGTPFLVGEALKGVQLDERLKKLVTFSVPVAVAAGISMCEGLEALHQTGIIHGDVGTHTVSITTDGSLRLQMGGLWEAYSASSTAGALVLSSMAPYMAPEVTAGGMPSASSDLYAVGIVLFELLTGRQPYLADTSVALAMKHSTAPTPNARLFNPVVPPVLDEIVKKAMAKDPSVRYASAADLLGDLRILQDALRFGKTIAWPLRKAVEATTPPPTPVVSKVKEIKVESKPLKSIREPVVYDDEPRGDVPGWLKLTIAFFGAVVLCMLGIWTVFNFNKAQDISVPNLVKMNREEASAALKNLGLRMRVAREQSSETYPADTIIDSNPPPADFVKEGGEVRVVVSSGSKFVEVPDLRGLTVDEARRMLDTKRLLLDDRVRQVRDRELAVGLIVNQGLEPRSKVERGTKVWVAVSAGNDFGEQPDRTDNERYAYTLRITTSDIPKAVTVRVIMTDARGVSTVHEQDHEPDEEFSIDAEGYGREVTFRIFYDGVLVKQVTQTPSDGGG